MLFPLIKQKMGVTDPFFPEKFENMTIFLAFDVFLGSKGVKVTKKSLLFSRKW